MNQLWVRNRQRDRRIAARPLRRMTFAALRDLGVTGPFQLGLHLVGARAMTRLNETFLGHEGPTDVITFDHSDGTSALYGEIYVCVAEAVEQARRWRTSWQSEIVRYVLHGLLHLLGFDDKNAPARRAMKARENRLVRKLASQFPLSELGANRKV